MHTALHAKTHFFHCCDAKGIGRRKKATFVLFVEYYAADVPGLPKERREKTVVFMDMSVKRRTPPPPPVYGQVGVFMVRGKLFLVYFKFQSILRALNINTKTPTFSI